MHPNLERRRFYLPDEVMQFIDEQARESNMSPSLYVEEVVRACMFSSPTLKDVSVEK